MICKTELRKKSLYSAIYVFWSKVIFKELIPYTLLIALNGCIIHAIFKSQSLRKKHSAMPIKKLSVRSIFVKPVKKGIHFDYSRILNIALNKEVCNEGVACSLLKLDGS